MDPELILAMLRYVSEVTSVFPVAFQKQIR